MREKEQQYPFVGGTLEIGGLNGVYSTLNPHRIINSVQIWLWFVGSRRLTSKGRPGKVLKGGQLAIGLKGNPRSFFYLVPVSLTEVRKFAGYLGMKKLPQSPSDRGNLMHKWESVPK